MDVPNIVGDKEIYPNDKSSDKGIFIRDSYTEEIIGEIPDLKYPAFYKSIAQTYKDFEEWKKISIKERLRRIRSAAVDIHEIDIYDEIIARSGNHPIKNVRRSREVIAYLMRHAEDIARYAYGDEAVDEDLVDGFGPVMGALSVTTPEIMGFVFVHILLAGCVPLMKGNTQEPTSGYMVSRILRDKGAPVNFITYDIEAPNKRGWGKQLYEDSAKLIYMGDPANLKKMIYSDLPVDTDKLPNPSKVIDFVGHGAVNLVDETADLDLAAESVKEGNINAPKACKMSPIVLVDERVKDEFVRKLIERYKGLKVGLATDNETDVPLVSSKYWETHVLPYLMNTRVDREFLYGDEQMNHPIILEGVPQSIWGLEPGYPILCIREMSDINEGIELVKKIARNLPNERFLELSVYTSDERNLERIKKAAPAYNIHLNESVLAWNLYLPHEGKILCRELSDIQGFSGILQRV